MQLSDYGMKKCPGSEVLIGYHPTSSHLQDFILSSTEGTIIFSLYPEIFFSLAITKYLTTMDLIP